MCIRDRFTTTNGNNDGKYSNPEYDKLMETARTTGDANVRFDSMHQAEQIIMDEAGAIPVAFYSDCLLYTSKAGECVACGACEKRCPFGVPAVENMKQAADMFGK